MRRTIVAVAAVGMAAIVVAWSVPSRADWWVGPRERDGQCWHGAATQGAGYWAPCPKPAAAVVPHQTSRRHHS